MLQSSAFAPSAQSLLPLKPRRASNPSFDPISLSSSSAASPKRRDLNNVTVSASLPCRSWSLSSSSSSPFKLRPWSSMPLATSGDEANRFEARATSVPESAGESVESNSLVKTPVLGLLFGLWYVFNIYFKQGLKVYLNPYKKPKVSGAQLLEILPLALVHTLGNLFTNMSLGKVAVSFTHTIKAMAPFFSVVLSAMFLRELPTPSLVPIVVEWDWLRSLWPLLIGVQWLPMCNQSRNVLFKKVMINKEEAIVNITLFSIITVMSVLLLAPDFIHRRCQVCTSFYTTCCIERSANIHENACCCSLLPCLPAGIIYDLGEGITCYSLCRQPCEAGGGRSGKGTELFGLPSHLFVVIVFVLLLLIQRGILFF